MVIRLLNVSILLIAVCFSGLSSANEAITDLRTLHKLQLDLLEAASLFHRYQGSEGNKKFYTSITDLLDDVKKSLSESEAALIRHNLTAEAQTLKSNATTYIKNLNTALAAIKNGGFADFSIIDAYLGAHDTMLKALNDSYQAIATSGSYNIPPLVTALRNETLLMQKMYAKYIESSSSQFGYTPRSGQEDAETIDQLAARFSRNLDKLKQDIPVNSAYASRINDVKTKWLFLEKSFLNYTEQTVPYLITKFGKQIISELSAIADEMEGVASN